jgi:hypothetical protein
MAQAHRIRSLGVFSSGGDSQGMNAALRAVVRTALNEGADVYAIYEGYEGMVQGGDLHIRQFGWDDVGGILHRGRHHHRLRALGCISHSAKAVCRPPTTWSRATSMAWWLSAATAA